MSKAKRKQRVIDARGKDIIVKGGKRQLHTSEDQRRAEIEELLSRIKPIKTIKPKDTSKKKKK